MDLTTKYLGLNLRSPLVHSASPLAEDIDNIKRMEQAGIAACVFNSIFEEQLMRDEWELHERMAGYTESFAEATTFFPDKQEYFFGPEMYLEHIIQAKKAVGIPIIASLNGYSTGGWTEFARRIEEAGADALELNIYNIPTDMSQSSQEVEEIYLNIARSVRSTVKIPVAVKLSPYFSNMMYIAKKFDEIGINGLVLFNRFYQPDIDLEQLEVRPGIIFSTPFAIRLPLRWIALLYGRINADLAATSGIHKSEDVIKMIMVGASATMLCSVLLRQGIDQIRVIENDLIKWMTGHGYESVNQMRGCMSQIHCADPSAFERAQYVRSLRSYKSF